MRPGGEALPVLGQAAGASQATRTGCEPDGSPSYLEIEIGPATLNLFERQGDGKTAEVIQALARYGLHLATRVSSPCG